MSDRPESDLETSAETDYVHDSRTATAGRITVGEDGRMLIDGERPLVLIRPQLAPRAEGESMFCYAVRNAMRRKPAIVFAADAKDRDAVKAAIETALA